METRVELIVSSFSVVEHLRVDAGKLLLVRELKTVCSISQLRAVRVQSRIETVAKGCVKEC